MARIRTIKPEFWMHEQIGRCTPLARLSFIGLVNHADDEGRGRAGAELLVGLMHSYSTPRVKAGFRKALAELRQVKDNKGSIIIFYEVAGAAYYWIPGFTRQQRIDKPSPSKLPAPPDSAIPPGTVREESALEGKGSGKGKEGKGKEEEAPLPSGPSPAPQDTGEHAILTAMKSQRVGGTPIQKRDHIQTWRARGYKAGEIEAAILQPDNAGAHVWDLDKLCFPFKGGKDGKAGGGGGLVRDVACARCNRKGIIKQTIGGISEQVVNCPDCGGTGYKKGTPGA